jgi:hypothetical protein
LDKVLSIINVTDFTISFGFDFNTVVEDSNTMIADFTSIYFVEHVDAEHVTGPYFPVSP